MKILKMIILVLTFATVGSTFTACDSNNAAQNEEEDKRYTAAYVCPMHCAGSGSDEMGTCPVCGMDYVVNEEREADGHTHD